MGRGTPTSFSPPRSPSRPLDGQLENTRADYASSHPMGKCSTIAYRMPVLQARQSEDQSSLVARMVDVAVETTPWPHPSHDIPAPVAPLAPEQDSEESFRPLGSNSPRLHTCSVCGQGFRRPYLLKDHMMSRHAVAQGSYPCDHPGCGLKYTTLSNMTRHRRSEHKRVDSIHIASEVVPSLGGTELEPLHGVEYLDNLLASADRSKFAGGSKRARIILAAHRDREPSKSTRDIFQNRGAARTTGTDSQVSIARQHEGTRSVGGTQDEHTSSIGPVNRLGSNVTPAPVSRERTASPMETTPAIEGTSDHSAEEVTDVCDTGPHTAAIAPDASVSESGSGLVASTRVLSRVGRRTLRVRLPTPDTFVRSAAKAANHEPAVRVPVPILPPIQSLSHTRVSPTNRSRSPRSPRSASPPRVVASRTLYSDPYLPRFSYEFDPTRAFSSVHTPWGDGGSIWSGQGPGRNINISPPEVSELSRIVELLGSDSLRSYSNAHADRSTSEQSVPSSGSPPLQGIDAIFQRLFPDGFLLDSSLGTSQSSGLVGAQPASSLFQAGSTRKESSCAGEGAGSLRSSEPPVPPAVDATRPIIPAEITQICLSPGRAPQLRSLMGADEPQSAKPASRPLVQPAQQGRPSRTRVPPGDAGPDHLRQLVSTLGLPDPPLQSDFDEPGQSAYLRGYADAQRDLIARIVAVAQANPRLAQAEPSTHAQEEGEVSVPPLPVAPAPQSNQADTSLKHGPPAITSEAFDETMSQSHAPPIPPRATVLEHPEPCSRTLGASTDPTNNTPAPHPESESDTQNAENHHNLAPSQPVAPVDIASSLPPAPEPPPSLVHAVPYPSLPTPAATPITQGESNKSHVCSICGAAYPRPYLLRDHMLSKHGNATEKPHACDFEGCDSRFTTRSNMRKHFNQKHRGSGTPRGNGTN